jgi:5'-nucleotidase
MRILVTNDDGFENDGIWALVNAIKHLGDVTVVAPAGNQSGVGAGISFRKSVYINKAVSRVDGVDCYAVGGTPADSVILGIQHVLNGKVDAIVVGINPGFNTSRHLFLSGTMGAAIMGAANGVKSCAFSMDHIDNINDQSVGSIITAIAKELIDPSTPHGALFNVNFPSLSFGGIKGAESAVPAPSELKGMIEPQSDGGFEIYGGLKVNIDRMELTPGTDLEVLNRHRVAISALDGPTLTHQPNDPSLKRMIDAAIRVIG